MDAKPAISELSKTWSTQAVAPQHRLDYWVGAICEAFLEMDCSSKSAPSFEGRLTHIDAGQLSFNQVLSSASDVYRTQSAIARSQFHPFYLITHLTTDWNVRQGGQSVHVRPGDAVLVDSAQRYELHFPQAVNVMSIQLPRSWVGQWLAEPGTTARVAPKDQGWGQALSGLCTQLGKEPGLAMTYPTDLLADQLGAMLAAALEPHARDASASSPDLVASAKKLLAQRLDQTGLTADEIAQALGVSTRTLHRSFASEQLSLAGTLRSMRLRQATHLLEQVRLRHLSVAEIGRRCGFLDVSHFVRSYKNANGDTPAHWRRQAKSLAQMR